MTNTIMILGANTLQLPLIKRANEMGYNTLVVSPIKNEPGHEIAVYSEICDVVDEKGVLNIAKKYDICGVITDQTDLPVRTVAYIANELGLPVNGYGVANIFTDKYLMREKCKELGIKTVDYKLCHNVDEIKDFFIKTTRDIIIKPVDNQGSKGVGKVSSLSDISKKFNEAIVYSRSNSVLVEEFIVGREFLVEGICANYEYKNLCCGDTEYFDLPDVFSASKREFPSVAPEPIVKKVLDLNLKIGRGFGLKQGLTHAEYILDGEDVILLEIAARGGGVFISSDLIPLQTGLDTEEFLIGISTGKINKIPTITSKNRSCCYISFFLPKGKIVSIEGIDEVVKLDYTYHNNFDSLKVGKVVEQNKDKTSRYFVILDAKDHEELMSRRTVIKKTIKIDVMDDKGVLKGIIWG